MTRAAFNNWQSVQDEVVRRIHTHTWKQGDLIPNEADLALEFGCARATVNRALQNLADAGLLDRRRKAGTRVAVLPLRKATLEIPVIRKEIASRGHAYSYALISRGRAAPPAVIAAKMHVPAGTRMLHLLCLHSADGKPYVLEDRWINTAEVPAAASVDFTQQSPNEWLVTNVPFTAGDISFSAMSAGEEESNLLRCDLAAGLFVIDRMTRRLEQGISSVRLIFAPGYRMDATL